MLVAWVLFPLVLGLLALGCGLLLQRVAGVSLQGVLLLPAGLTVVVVVSQLLILNTTTADFAAPAVAALAVLGIALGRPWRNLDLDWWAGGAAVAVFAAFGAPAILSGDATWAGFLRLDDTASWFAITDRLTSDGRNLDNLPPSTFQDILFTYLSSGYPVGAFLPLAVGRILTGSDVAWVFQPYIAFLGAMLALAFYSIAGWLTPVRWQRAVAAFVGSQAALLYGYSLVGGVKEVASAALIALAAALVPIVLEARRPLSVLPLAMATGAALSVMSFGGMAWFFPILLGTLVILVVQRGAGFAARHTLWFVGLAVVACLPAVPAALDFLENTTGILTNKGDVGGAGGALLSPLNDLQVFGIWPTGDYRLTPGNEAATYFLIGVAGLAAIIGLVWAVVRRAPSLLLLVAGAALALLVITIPGSPWVDAKAFAIASPVFIFTAMAGAIGLARTGRRFEAVLVAAAIAAGVLWSNALAYNESYIAPHERMSEMQELGQKVRGEGPTLMIDVSLYASHHFLRDSEPNRIAVDSPVFRPGRSNPVTVPGIQKHYVDPKVVADVDNYDLRQLLHFRTLFLPRSPAGSRPPSIYKLTERTTNYEIWQRPEPHRSKILEHVSLPDDLTRPGALLQPVAEPSCKEVMRLARVAGPRGRLAAVVRRPTTLLPLSAAIHPPSWQSDPLGVYPTGSGTVRKDITAKRAQKYQVWLNGAFRQPVKLKLNGEPAGKTNRQLMLTSEYALMGDVTTKPGMNRFELDYGGSELYPGSGGEPLPLGPVILSSGDDDRPITYVPTARARELCGKTLDWIEALSS